MGGFALLMSDKESSTALEDQIFGSSSSEDEGAYDSSSEGHNVGITTTRKIRYIP